MDYEETIETKRLYMQSVNEQMSFDHSDEVCGACSRTIVKLIKRGVEF